MFYFYLETLTIGCFGPTFKGNYRHQNCNCFSFDGHLIYFIFILPSVFSVFVQVVTSASSLTFPSFLNWRWWVYLLLDSCFQSKLVGFSLCLLDGSTCWACCLLSETCKCRNAQIGPGFQNAFVASMLLGVFSYLFRAAKV